MSAYIVGEAYLLSLMVVVVSGVVVARAIGWMGELDGAEKRYCSIGSGGSYPDGRDGHVDFLKSDRCVCRDPKQERKRRGEDNDSGGKCRQEALMTMRGTIHANSGEDHQKARRERERREDRDVCTGTIATMSEAPIRCCLGIGKMILC